MRYRPTSALLSLALLGGQSLLASAQQPIIIGEYPPTSQQAVVNASHEEAPPISPATSPGPLSLDACLDLGFQHQPALDAARASLAAAHSGKRAVDRLIIPRIIRKDLPVRREQACLGVTIASAGLTQVEWETRYAVTRNFFTVQYIRSQKVVIDDVLRSITTARARGQKLFDEGNPAYPITKLDLDSLDIAIAQVNVKKAQIDNGYLKAQAALREAMGVRHDYPLDIAAAELPPITYKFDKEALIASAIANRGELAQAAAASRVSALEVEAQSLIRGWQANTFASGADIHAKQIPQGIFNNEYRPGAIGLEMPPMLIGRKRDRVDRASDLDQRSSAVVDKTTNLVSLDVEAQYLKWQEALDNVKNLSAIQKLAANLPDRVQKLDPKNFTGDAVIRANTTAIMVRTQLNEELHIHALALAGLERATAGAFRIYPIPAASK